MPTVILTEENEKLAQVVTKEEVQKAMGEGLTMENMIQEEDKCRKV